MAVLSLPNNARNGMRGQPPSRVVGSPYTPPRPARRDVSKAGGSRSRRHTAGILVTALAIAIAAPCHPHASAHAGGDAALAVRGGANVSPPEVVAFDLLRQLGAERRLQDDHDHDDHDDHEEEVEGASIICLFE